MKAKVIGAMVVMFLVGWMAGTAKADFNLTGTQHRDVTTNHTIGRLFDASTADVLRKSGDTIQIVLQIWPVACFPRPIAGGAVLSGRGSMENLGTPYRLFCKFGRWHVSRDPSPAVLRFRPRKHVPKDDSNACGVCDAAAWVPCQER